MKNRSYQNSQFEILYSKYSNLLYRIALSQLGNKEDAEDAVQDAFIKMLSSSFKFSSDSEEKAWSVKVLVNGCRDILRKRRVRFAVPLDELVDVPSPSEESHRLFEAISNLSEKHRIPVILHYLEDFSIEEISKALSLSVSGVKMRLLRGREELLSLLGKGNMNV